MQCRLWSETLGLFAFLGWLLILEWILISMWTCSFPSSWLVASYKAHTIYIYIIECKYIIYNIYIYIYKYYIYNIIFFERRKFIYICIYIYIFLLQNTYIIMFSARNWYHQPMVWDGILTLCAETTLPYAEHWETWRTQNPHVYKPPEIPMVSVL